MTSPVEPSYSAGGPPAVRKRRGWVKWAIPVVALLVGVGIGSAGSGSQSQTVQAVAKQKTADKVQIDNLTGQVTAAKQSATIAGKSAQDRAASDYASRMLAVKQREDKVAVREKAAGIAEAAQAANTFAGTGTYLVGSDVKPGTYRAPATPGCYWARLRSLTTSDIIDNSNADGPVIVSILSSDKAFQASGCGAFTKIS